MKWRNSKERELLASGGSRDQTLPNKNNPNPDLSDARTDRQPSLSPASASPTPSGVEQSTQNLDHFSGGSNNAGDQISNKFDGRKENACNGKNGKQFKIEKCSSESGQSFADQFIPSSNQILLSHIGATSEENRQQQQYFFNNFYEKIRNVNNPVLIGSEEGTAESGKIISNYYFDDFDSNSDEEISVT